jgi:hypothetical protein
MALTEQEVAAIVAKYAVKLKDWKSRNENDRYNQVTKERLASVTYPEYWEG